MLERDTHQNGGANGAVSASIREKGQSLGVIVRNLPQLYDSLVERFLHKRSRISVSPANSLYRFD